MIETKLKHFHDSKISLNRKFLGIKTQIACIGTSIRLKPLRKDLLNVCKLAKLKQPANKPTRQAQMLHQKQKKRDFVITIRMRTIVINNNHFQFPIGIYCNRFTYSHCQYMPMNNSMITTNDNRKKKKYFDAVRNKKNQHRQQ